MTCRLLVAALSLVLVASAAVAADKKDEAAELVKKLSEGTAAERDDAERALRKMGAAAITALRDAKVEKEEAITRVRNTLTDLVLDTSKIVPEDATLVHEIAREEGKGKRYNNAERLYRRAEKIYDKLKEDADDQKERAKAREYADKREVCDRMKDKAGHKARGETGTGVNLGLVRIGTQHDLSDDWE